MKQRFKGEAFKGGWVGRKTHVLKRGGDGVTKAGF